MPNSRKRFSKNKKSVKKSKKSRKNTRKHKKTTPRRKYKKFSKRFRFFGGNGDEEPDECSICLEFLTKGEPIFTTNCNHNFHPDCIIKHCKYVTCLCPMCRTKLNPNPNPTPEEDPVPPPPNVFPAFANIPIVVEYPNLYRVEFFKFRENRDTGEIEKVKISVHDMDDETINSLNGYFMGQIPGLTNDHLDFFGDPARRDPNGYINLYNNLTRVEIPLGDMEITIGNSNDIETATITQTNTHN
jgi:hypothetical protein